MTNCRNLSASAENATRRIYLSVTGKNVRKCRLKRRLWPWIGGHSHGGRGPRAALGQSAREMLLRVAERDAALTDRRAAVGLPLHPAIDRDELVDLAFD